MIEITAKLIGGPVYLPGENVGCYITFTNPPLPAHIRSRSNRDTLESLAWASAQIHCLCSTNGKVPLPSKTPYLPEEKVVSNSDTSYAPCRGDRGRIVLSTTPKILFCDLKLAPGESKSYFYSQGLPLEALPSYTGQLVKYSYKITIGTQRVPLQSPGSVSIPPPVKLLRVPLRVLDVSGVPEDRGLCEDSEDLSPSNPFLESTAKDHEQDPTIQLLQNITARRNPNFYNITNSKGKVARFCLFKQAYKLGEDIIGTFDFSGATVPCVQFTVTLQSEEVIGEEYKADAKQMRAIVSFSNCHEVCLSMKQCLLNLPIPLHATPTFSTRLVSLRWRLHFEFVTTQPDSVFRLPPDSSTWQGPGLLTIETMIWDLPIQIYPSLPTPEPQTNTQYSQLV
ncbi:RAB6A-GEF complex partner protein 2 [Macrosteles quadrilineatus]|uniref:RAB6A-GEF complex partner protein 2 n=1 Tax=Macrosteles quadrilineatus TaxID=74068 RepID=UPI0023E2C6E8|nr:RAB6A-GEF complex partner protein 2 [Macrosteles quadrilineatus]XP_054258122.1 RAB6A-GEF complex partner protein 2 [Macrosteles quadrilineatus]